MKLWMTKTPPASPMSTTPAKWRALFSQCLEDLSLAKYQFRPYSLRRGGATFWFSKHQSLDQILVQGRWHTQKSARIYLNEGLSVLASMRIPVHHPNIQPFYTVFHNTVKSPRFGTLEPPQSGRSGGFGKRGKRKGRASKNFARIFFSLCRANNNYCILST